MEGIDKKTAGSSTVSSKSGKKIVDSAPSASRPVSQSVEQPAGDGLISCRPDPTRFGDWEHAGRCIDF